MIISIDLIQVQNCLLKIYIHKPGNCRQDFDDYAAPLHCDMICHLVQCCSIIPAFDVHAI